MKVRILYVEDNDANFYLVHYILTQRGHEVLRACDAPSGLRMACEHKPDLILLDIQLPGMDGLALLAELRRQPELKDVPIVALTSYAMPGDREQALNAGCSGYIEKPLNPRTFADEIETFFRSKAAS